MPFRHRFSLLTALIVGMPATAGAAPSAVPVQRPATSSARAETPDVSTETPGVPTPPKLPAAQRGAAPMTDSPEPEAVTEPAIETDPSTDTDTSNQVDDGATSDPAVADETTPLEQPGWAPKPLPHGDPPSVLDVEPAGGADRWKRDYVKVQRPRFRGTGMLVTAGSLYATALAFQLGDATLCGNCARGVLERAFLGSAFALAPFGAAKRGRSDAYYDAAGDRPLRNSRAILIGGAALTAVGVGAGLANEVMWWRCMSSEQGPYVIDDAAVFGPACRYGVGRLTLDLSAAAATAGVSMLAWSLRYRKDSAVYERARLSVAPALSSNHTGLTVTGQF